MTKGTKKAGDLAKATGGIKPPAAKAAPAIEEKIEISLEEVIDQVTEEVPAETKADEPADQVTEEVPAETKADEPPDQVTEEVPAETKADEPADQVTEEKAETGNDHEVETGLKKREKMISEAKEILEIMDRCKVDKLYRNPKGEYFTVLNFAMLSVGQDRKSLQHYDRRVLEAVIKLKAE